LDGSQTSFPRAEFLHATNTRWLYLDGSQTSFPRAEFLHGAPSVQVKPERPKMKSLLTRKNWHDYNSWSQNLRRKMWFMSVQGIPNEAPQVADSNGHDLYIAVPIPKLCNQRCLLCFFDSTQRLYPSGYKKNCFSL
jgi:hypothetical protein